MRLKNRYFILRHGETIYQTKKKKIIYPPPEKQSSIKLTKKGEIHVKKAAEKLKKEKIDIIYSSDMHRTRQTAQIIAKELDLKVNLDKRLCDVNLGIYHGRSKREFYKDFDYFSIKRFREKPPRGESWSDCKNRMINFLKDIEKRQKGKKILIVSHGDPLWLLEGVIKGWSVKKFLQSARTNYIKTGELKKLYGA